MAGSSSSGAASIAGEMSFLREAKAESDKKT
jgi:hypothetical protein